MNGDESTGLTRIDLREIAQVDMALLHENMPCGRSLHKEWEIVHVHYGGFDVMVDDMQITLTAGQTLFLGAFTIHEFMPPKEALEAFRIKLLPEWAEAPFWCVQERDRFRRFRSDTFVVEKDKRLELVFQELQKEATAYLGLANVMRIIALLTAEPSLIIHSLSSSAGMAGRLPDTMEFLHQHCREPLTLGDLASYMNMSESHCSRFFHQMTGVTFTECLNTLRISDARHLLSRSNLSVIEIAQEVGYSCIQTFNRVFRRNCGQTPSEYRDNIRASVRQQANN
ncbi:MAG: AraC family transcriptional regulator [Eubacteriales bacterium]|nr:AraC family transcriptional regulator [Eubacteriales bacterium]